MRVFLIRHSVPEDDDYDEDDPGLTKEGRQLVKAQAERMLDKGDVPNLIIASPSVRTQETAELLAEELGLPKPRTDVSIGPSASIRGLVKKIAADPAMARVAIVSHHETIANGLRELGQDPHSHLDKMAQGEVRILKVDRDDGTWKERKRVLPSDIGFADHY